MASSQSGHGRGKRNEPGAQYSEDTQLMLRCEMVHLLLFHCDLFGVNGKQTHNVGVHVSRVYFYVHTDECVHFLCRFVLRNINRYLSWSSAMMQQSRLTNRQRKQINECLKDGAALPLTSDPTSTTSPTEPKTSKSVQRRLLCTPQRRTAEACRSGNSYVREKFHPGPSRDLEKEKMRLQNILATGEEQPTPASYRKVPNPEVAEQKDRYQEVLDEIEERRQFLADMSSLGQEKQYIIIINTQISQRIRELQVLDKARSPKNDAITSERDEESAEQIPEKMELKETRERRLTATD